MENNDSFIKVCNMLTQLAILKDRKIEEKAIALMAKFLLSELSVDDISSSCAYLSKREKGFPDVSMFFNLVCPMPTLEEVVEREIGGLVSMISDGWTNSKDKFTDIQKDLLSVWSWGALEKDKDLQKTRINMTFFLRNKLGSEGKLKILMSKKAFVDYHNDLKQLEQGEQNEQVS